LPEFDQLVTLVRRSHDGKRNRQDREIGERISIRKEDRL
jgi:hypothetical protein